MVLLFLISERGDTMERKYTLSSYVPTLPQRNQKRIRRMLQQKGVTGADLEKGMSGHLSDLDDALPVNKLLHHLNSRGIER